MRAVLLTAAALLVSAPASGSAVAQTLSATASPVSGRTIARGLEPSEALEFVWGLEVRTGREDLIDFTGYALAWSSFRLSDDRILSLAFSYEPGASAPNGIRQARLDHGVPSSAPVDQARIFIAPARWPRIEGYRFLDGARVSPAGARKFVGLWASETSPERLLVAFDDPSISSGPAGFTILGRTEMDADVVSASAPLHGGAPLVSMATRPTADGAFTILTYRWLAAD